MVTTLNEYKYIFSIKKHWKEEYGLLNTFFRDVTEPYTFTIEYEPIKDIMQDRNVQICFIANSNFGILFFSDEIHYGIMEEKQCHYIEFYYKKRWIGDFRIPISDFEMTFKAFCQLFEHCHINYMKKERL